MRLNNRNDDVPIVDRVLSAAPYLLPIADGITYSRYGLAFIRRFGRHTHTRHNRARRLTHPPTIFFLSIKIRFLAMYAPELFQPIYAFLDPFLAVCEWL